MTTGRTVRTTRGARTRKRVLEVTRQLLSGAGPRSVTLDQVAEQSRVAKTSILWHFGSKQELFLEVLDEAIGDFERTFSARYPDGSSPVEKLASFFRDYTELMRQHPRLGDVFFSFVFGDRSDQRVKGRARDLYRRYRAMVASHISTVAEGSRGELAAAIVGLVDGVFIQWSVEPDALDPRAVFDAFLSAFALVESAPAEREAGPAFETPATGGG